MFSFCLISSRPSDLFSPVLTQSSEELANEIHHEAFAGNTKKTSRGQLITATRFSISDRDEFKRGREYPLLAVSGSVSRDAWMHCAPGDRRTLHHQGEIPRDGEKEPRGPVDAGCSAPWIVWASQIDRARKRRRPRSIYLFAPNEWRNSTRNRTNCLLMEIMPARNRNFRRYPWRHLRRRTNCPIFFPDSFFLPTLLFKLWTSICEMVPIKFNHPTPDATGMKNTRRGRIAKTNRLIRQRERERERETGYRSIYRRLAVLLLNRKCSRDVFLT